MVPCWLNRSDNSSARHPPYVVIIRIKLSSNPRPERVRQLYSGFYWTLDLEQNAELRILLRCSPIPCFNNRAAPWPVWLAIVSRQTTYFLLPLLSPLMESPKRERISYAKAGILMVDQVKPAILERTAVRFDLPKG